MPRASEILMVGFMNRRGARPDPGVGLRHLFQPHTQQAVDEGRNLWQYPRGAADPRSTATMTPCCCGSRVTATGTYVTPASAPVFIETLEAETGGRIQETVRQDPEALRELGDSQQWLTRHCGWEFRRARCRTRQFSCSRTRDSTYTRAHAPTTRRSTTRRSSAR